MENSTQITENLGPEVEDSFLDVPRGRELSPQEKAAEAFRARETRLAQEQAEFDAQTPQTGQDAPQANAASEQAAPLIGVSENTSAPVIDPSVPEVERKLTSYVVLYAVCPDGETPAAWAQMGTAPWEGASQTVAKERALAASEKFHAPAEKGELWLACVPTRSWEPRRVETEPVEPVKPKFRV